MEVGEDQPLSEYKTATPKAPFLGVLIWLDKSPQEAVSCPHRGMQG